MTSFSTNPLGLRGRLLLSALGAITVVLGALTLGFNLVLADRQNHDAKSVALARASAELASLRIAHGRILLPEAPDDRSPDIQIWIFQGTKPIEHPRTSGANDAAAATLASGARAASTVASTNTRLFSLPVVQSRHRLGAVVAGVSLRPYEQSRHTTLVASAVLALAVLVAFGIAARWLIGRALRPVARMTRQAADWSEHDLDRRFALGPPKDELTELAGTLDELLERLASSLRHEQRLSAEISHELRTPLASIVAEAQYGLRHGQQTEEGSATLEHILQSARALARTLDTLMAAARAQLNPNRATSDAVACAHEAVKANFRAHGSSQPEIVVNAPRDPIRLGVEHDLVERILAPLLENATKHAQQLIALSVARVGDEVQFTVQDDGPGIPDETRETIFKPGNRGSGSPAATAVASSGAGLGLALCRRLARSAGGDVQAQPSEDGARFLIRLPAA